MRIWVVESWDNALTPSKDGDFHDITLAYLADSEEVAKEWCRKNKDYAGKSGFWHWRIFTKTISSNPETDPDEVYGEHWLRDMSQLCDSDGDVLEREESDDEDLSGKIMDLEGCIDENTIRIQRLEDSLTEVLNELEELKEGTKQCRPKRKRK